jgi:N-acetylglucosamine kinase-like BadF-type ATPase
MVEVITRLGLRAPLALHNDAILGLVAGAEEGWGITVVSGSGCNCWGWNQDRSQVGRVTGFGTLCGEAAGGTELVYHAMQRVAHAWTQRGPGTALSQAFVSHTGALDVEDLLEGYTTGRILVDSEAAPLVFKIAELGDPVASQLVQWAGCELGELAKAVIRQLNFQEIAFDVILVGSMFEAGEQLVAPMRETILELASKAHLVRLGVLPVVGAVLLGMQAGGSLAGREFRKNLYSYFH